jgi:hypothetical protein
MQRLPRRVLIAIALAFPWVPARAQLFDSVPRLIERPESDVAGLFGGELSIVIPRGDFRFGNGATFGWGLRGGVGFGKGVIDVGGTYRSILRDSRSYGDTSVNNMMRTLGIDARLTLPLGPLRPYVGGALGVAYFGTETSVEQCCDEDYEPYDEFEDARLVRFTPLTSTRFGVMLDVSSGRPGSLRIAIDLGVENHYGGRASYQLDGRGPVHTTRTGFRSYNFGVVMRSR